MLKLIINLLIIAVICYFLNRIGLGIIPQTIGQILQLCIGVVANVFHAIVGTLIH